MFFQTLNFADTITKMIDKKIDEKLKQLPLILPCCVVGKNKNCVDVKLSVSIGNDKTITDIPIAQSKYIKIPIKQGDFGLLIPSSYYFNSIVKENINYIINVLPSTAMSNFIFLPFCKDSDVLSNNLEITDGMNKIKFEQGKIVINNNLEILQ